MLDEYAVSTGETEATASFAALYPRAPRAVHRALDHIHTHLDANLRLEDIAAAARLSVYHFSRTFRKAMGIGPHRYVVQARVERAKALLRSGNRALAEIADETGFSDQSHMSKVFRRFTGLSPRAYRATHPYSRCPLHGYFESLRRNKSSRATETRRTQGKTSDQRDPPTV